MTPSQSDIKKREANLQKFLKQIDPETGRSSERKMLTAVRGAIRQSWMKSPTKLAYLYMKTVPDMDDSTRTKWKIQCECCGNWFKLNEIQIDHIQGNNSFTKIEDFESYFNSILMVGFDGLQALCAENCHPLKTLSESLNISFEDAKIEREVIALCKQKASQQDAFLAKHNVVCVKNAVARRNAIREILKEEMKDEIRTS
jgi:hypothetical protein